MHGFGHGGSLCALVGLVCVVGCAAAWAQTTTQEGLAGAVEQLSGLAEKLETEGRLDPYGRMRVALAARFMDYFKEDAEKHPDTLGAYAARDLARIVAEESARLKAIENGRAAPVDSPRRVASELPRIVREHLAQKVQWSDGRQEDRPVFLFGFGHDTHVQNDIELLAQMGINYCQAQLWWPGIVPAEGQWNQAWIDNMRRSIGRAGELGVLTDVIVSPHYMPGWAFEANPRWRIQLGGFLGWPINDPKPRALMAGWIERAVRELADTKAFWSACLINEPSFFFWTADPDTKRLWRSFLISRHGTVEKLNERWGTEYKDWSETSVYSNPNEDNYIDPPGSYDWMRFNDERIASFIEWLGERVHAAAPDKLTHAKLLTRSFRPYDVMQGIDPELIQRTADLAGTDDGAGPSYFLFKSIAAKPLVNSEHHFLGDGSTNDQPQGKVRRDLWLAALYGLDASIAWIWGRDSREYFVGNWSYRPGPTEEYLRTGLDLMRLMPEIVALREAPVRATILYSRTSVLRDSDHADLLAKTASALLEMNIPFGIVTEQMLSAGQVQKRHPSASVLILPGVVHLPQDAMDALPWVQRAGKSLMTVGNDFAKFDAYHHPRKDVSISPLNVADPNAPAFADRLRRALQQREVTSPIRFVDPETQKNLSGVIVRTAPIKRGHSTFSKREKVECPLFLVTAVNVTDRPVRGVWTDHEGTVLTFEDQLNLQPGEPVTAVRLAERGVIFGLLAGSPWAVSSGE